MTRKTKALIVVVAAVFALLAAAPWLFPVSKLIPGLEARASEYLGEPVTISSLQLFLLPLPHVTATGISAGKKPILQIERISLTPSLAHVFSDQQAIEIGVRGAVAHQDALEKIAARRRSTATPDASASAPAVRIERVTLQDGELRLRGAVLKDLDGELRLVGGELSEIHVSSEGGKLKVIARPAQNGAMRLQVSARAWRLPAGPPIQLDTMEASALLTARGIESRDIRATLYGGRASGSLAIGWKPRWSVTGEAALEYVEVERLVAMFAEDVAVSGRLTAQPRFAARAARPADLVSALNLESDFVIEHGMLHKVDLVAAASNPLAREPAEPGTTRFDRLSSQLAIDADGYHFSNLNVASGLLAGSGHVSVLRDQRLDGRIDAQLKGTGSLITVPLRVAGTVDDPSVLPTKTAVVGAVAGSVLLPGVGTAVGLKASQLTEKLFGKKRRPNPELAQPPVASSAPAASPPPPRR